MTIILFLDPFTYDTRRLLSLWLLCSFSTALSIPHLGLPSWRNAWIDIVAPNVTVCMSRDTVHVVSGMAIPRTINHATILLMPLSLQAMLCGGGGGGGGSSVCECSGAVKQLLAVVPPSHLATQPCTTKETDSTDHFLVAYRPFLVARKPLHVCQCFGPPLVSTVSTRFPVVSTGCPVVSAGCPVVLSGLCSWPRPQDHCSSLGQIHQPSPLYSVYIVGSMTPHQFHKGDYIPFQ